MSTVISMWRRISFWFKVIVMLLYVVFPCIPRSTKKPTSKVGRPRPTPTPIPTPRLIVWSLVRAALSVEDGLGWLLGWVEVELVAAKSVGCVELASALFLLLFTVVVANDMVRASVGRKVAVVPGAGGVVEESGFVEETV